MNELKETTINGNTATIINFPPTLDKLISDYYDYKRIAEDAKKQLDALKADILELLNGRTRYENETHKAVVSVKRDGVTLDKDKLLEDFPDLLTAYPKTVKGSTSLTVRRK